MLPLKLWRPSLFDGVALAVGAASPDIAYVLDGSGLPVWPLSHQWLGIFAWCLPVTLALCWLIRRAAPVVAVHLPRGIFALRDYGALGTVRHRWLVTAFSAIVGAASHIVFDMTDRWDVAADWAGHLTGGAVSIAVLVHIGRKRLIMRWHGPAPAVAPRPARFWITVGVVAVVGLAIVPVLPAAFLMHTTGTRLITVVTIAFLAGASMVHVTTPRPARSTLV